MGLLLPKGGGIEFIANNKKNPSVILKNFPQFVVIHTVKGFRVVNEAEVDIFQDLKQLIWNSITSTSFVHSDVS